MLTLAEISAGSGRLTANKLKISDRETLLAVFLLYLKSSASNYPDIAVRLANLTDSADVKTASKLAAILTKLENGGFAVGELSGGRNGVKFKQQDQVSLQIRFALTLLGYTLPENFTGSLGSSGAAETDDNSSGSLPIYVW